MQATTPEYKAYQVQVLKNCARFAEVFRLTEVEVLCTDIDFILHNFQQYFYPISISCLTVSLLQILLHLQRLVEKGYELVSGGTENHLVLVNLKNKVKKN